MSHLVEKKNIIEKIWAEHVVAKRDGHPAVFAIDLVLLHEVTSAQAFEMLDKRGWAVFDAGRVVATLDHSIPTRKNRHEIFELAAKNQVEVLRKNALKHGINIYDYDSGAQGIVHVSGPELGLTQPGMTIICGDSHTSTHGAFGAMAFGVGTSEVGHVLASGCLLQDEPRTLKVEFRGKLKEGVFAKDVILYLISKLGVGGASGYIIEYCGELIPQLSMESRMTICNMSIECGARGGLISPDEITFCYLKGRAFAPMDSRWDEALDYWSSFRSDSGCDYDEEVVVDVSDLNPVVTWGTNPSQSVEIDKPVPELSELPDAEGEAAKRAMKYTGVSSGQLLSSLKVDWAFLGSCTNGRIEDFRVAASILKGKKIHPDVTFYVVPGSEMVMRQAKDEGLVEIFENAGASFRMPGCSLCLAMNDDRVPEGSRCISTSNRNFVGRQGVGSITHLASPATVAASAISGRISSAAEVV